MATQEIGWKSLNGKLHVTQEDAMIFDIACLLEPTALDEDMRKRAAEVLVGRRDEVLQALTVTKNPAIKPVRKKRKDAGTKKPVDTAPKQK